MLTRDEIAARVLDGIDRAGLAAIAQRFPEHPFAKYFDVERWIATNVSRAWMLGLHEGRRRRVLDLGAGFGYFLRVCRHLGHDVQGVDLPDPLYQAVTKLLGVPVLEHSVTPDAPVPAPLSPPFDVVTAHMICFNGHCSSALWSERDWSAFLERFIGATLHLELNRERNGTLYPRGVAELFGDRGAVITGHHVVFARVRPPRQR